MTLHFLTTLFSMFKLYEGELQMNRNRFINDPTHNTLQSDLYDQSMAEVLGRIETSALGSEFTGLPVVGSCEDRILFPASPNRYDYFRGHFA